MNSDVILVIYDFAADCRPLALSSRLWYTVYLMAPDSKYWRGGRSGALVLPKMVGPVWLESAADLVFCGNMPALEAAIRLIPPHLLGEVIESLLDHVVIRQDTRPLALFHSMGFCISASENINISAETREWYKANCSCIHETDVDVLVWGMLLTPRSVARMRSGLFGCKRERALPPINMPPDERGNFRRAVRYEYIGHMQDMAADAAIIDIGALVAAIETDFARFIWLFERAAVKPAGLVKIAAEYHQNRWQDASTTVAALKLYHQYGYKVQTDQLSPIILESDELDWLIEHYRDAVELAAKEPRTFTTPLYHKLQSVGIKLVPTIDTLRVGTGESIGLQLELDPSLLRTVSPAHHRGILTNGKWRELWRGSRRATTAYLVGLGFDADAVEYAAWVNLSPGNFCQYERQK